MALDDLASSRRQALCGLAVALVAPGALVAACGGSNSAGGTSATASPTASAASGSSATGGTSGGSLAALADVPVGGGKVVDRPGGGQLLLVRTSDTEVLAYDPTCPHRGVTVAPPANGLITCPGHGSQFDPASGALRRGPATKGLTPVAVKVASDKVVLA